jgi:small-conductance mechanosensitive channel
MSGVKAAIAVIPDWAAAIGIFVLAASLALLLYAGASKLILKIARDRTTFVHSLFLRVRRLVALALVLLTLNFAAQLPYVPDHIGDVVSRLLSVSVILLAGWTAIVAIDVGSTIYLNRIRPNEAADLLARKHFTQVRILRRAVHVLVIVLTIAAALMTFEPVRQFGVSLFASAGAAGLVMGLAARPVLSNLIAGIQLALAQPIRLNDVVIVEGEWGRIEEITSTYVVVAIWDWRRLVVPLSYFMEKPFQNWTRESSRIIGTVFLHVDYSVPVPAIRSKLQEIVQRSPNWDKDVVNLQVTDMKDSTVELRALVSAANSGQAWDLRCEVRESLLEFLREKYPQSLPRQRINLSHVDGELRTKVAERAYGRA